MDFEPVVVPSVEYPAAAAVVVVEEQGVELVGWMDLYLQNLISTELLRQGVLTRHVSRMHRLMLLLLLVWLVVCHGAVIEEVVL